ncbi:MAG TPA: hypothetical protein VGD30_07740, partial [Telluria sp.]
STPIDMARPRLPAGTSNALRQPPWGRFLTHNLSTASIGDIELGRADHHPHQDDACAMTSLSPVRMEQTLED